MNFSTQLTKYAQAGYAGVVVVTPEWLRAEAEARSTAKAMDRQFLRWTVTEGWKSNLPDKGTGASGLEDAIRHVRDEKTKRWVYVLHVSQEMFNDFVTRQSIRDALQVLKSQNKCLVFVAPEFRLPSDLDKELALLDFDLPDRALLTELAKAVTSESHYTLPSDETMQKVVDNALGLTVPEAENAFAYSLIATGSLDPKTVLNEKKQVVRKSGVLEFYEADENMADIGGLENYKEWVAQRAAGFSEEARKYGLPAPKGVLLVGVPGGGKSLSAKATAGLFGLPLIRFDVSALFGSLVGETESNMRHTLQFVERLAPVVLWVDEVEKALSGVQSSGQTDSGVAARTFGMLLTWMQERPKDKPVFVVMTANDVSQLPAPLMRKGRIDEIFGISLPHSGERAAIFKVHLTKRGRGNLATPVNLQTLAEASEGFVGAEIEEVVVSGMWKAFSAKKEPLAVQHLLEAIHETQPLSKTRSEEIKHVEEWLAQGRARPASRKPEVSTTSTPTRRLG